MAPWAGSTPRHARHLIPAGLPRRGELIAVCAVAILVAHLLLAQLTLVLALVLAAIGKAGRWRRWWLLVPAVVGLAWTLAAGPGSALAGFAAGPSAILGYLSAGHLSTDLGHPFAAFAGAQGWLPRQFPVALIGAAGEAALIGWLGWLHTDEWVVPPPRPGVIAAARRASAARAIRAGAVVTREGCALGVVPATGAVAELRWAEATRGTLVVGAAPHEVTLAGLQVVHAALRRRKPVVVLDPGDDCLARALGVACTATGTPLAAGSLEAAADAAQLAGAVDVEAASASRLWGRGPAPERRDGDRAAIDLGRVVRERTAALLAADSAELAARACTELAALAGELRRIGVDGDALVWAPRAELVPTQALARLLRASHEAGLSVLIGTTSPGTAAELSGLTGAALIYRVADQDLAAGLAARTGTRLVPRPLAAALAGRPPDTDRGPAVSGPDAPGYPGASGFPGAPGSQGASGYPSAAGYVAAASPGTGPPGAAASAVTVAAAADLVPSPVIPARTLLTLGPSEFVLTVSGPRPRLIAPGRAVPARLPHPVGRQRTAGRQETRWTAVREEAGWAADREETGWTAGRQETGT
jgi:hypothetical protein